MIKNIQIKAVWAWLAVATVSFSSLFAVITPGLASAASNYTWAGSSQINSANPKETYSRLSGSSASSFCSSDGCIYSNYGHTGAHPSSCKVSNIPDPKGENKSPWPSNVNKIIQVANVQGGVNDGRPDTSAKTAILYSLSSGSGGNCNVATTMIALDQGSSTSPNNADYAYTNESTIRNIYNGDTYVAGGDRTVYNQQYGSSDVKCPDYIKLTSAGATTGTLHTSTNINASQCEYDNKPNSEGVMGPLAVSITRTAPNNIPTDPHSDDNNTADDCAVPPETALRWLSCDLVTLGKTAAEVMDRVIQNFLFAPTDQIFSDQLKTAWNSFRIVGVVLILIAGLVMVISQAAGMELFDAYTVRKILPRLIVAAIGISLSWPLMKFAVTFFNDIGGWSHDLILFPFKDLYDHAIGSQLLGAGVLAVSLPIIIGALGIPGTISLIFTVILAILIALLVLAIRQIVILMAVVMAPLAIAAYILPGTQKLWTFWKDAFITSLVMFPIIMGFIAAGKALAAVAGSVPNSPEMHLLAVLAYFAPYFLLPFAFKLAGGLMATVFSIANDRSRGLFDRGRKRRQEIMAERRGRAAGNSLWDPRHKRANTIASWIADPGSNATYGLGKRGMPGFKRGAAKISGMIEHAKVEQSSKLFEELNNAGYNDKAYRAISGVHGSLDVDDGKMSMKTKRALSEEGLLNRSPASLSEIQTMGGILSRSDKDAERLAGNAILGSQGRLATLFQDPEMTKAGVGAAGIIGLSAHGFADGADLAAAGNLLTHGKKEEAGYAQSIVSQAQLRGMRSRPDVKPGYGVVYKNGEFVDGMSDDGGRMSSVLDTFSSADLAGAKGGAIERVTPEIKRRLEGKRGATPEEAARYKQAQEDQLFSWAGPYSQASADVKAQALKIIDDMSGGRKTQTRQVRTADGQTVTQEYTGYSEGTLGAKFERYARTEMDPNVRGEGGRPEPEGEPGGGPQG